MPDALLLCLLSSVLCPAVTVFVCDVCVCVHCHVCVWSGWEGGREGVLPSFVISWLVLE